MTALPLRARLAPWIEGPEPEPVAKPPPCSHTITGRLLPPVSEGVYTLRTRQSSPCAGEFGLGVAFGLPACGAVGPYTRASRTPDHLAGLAAGWKRFLPVGGAP